MRMRSGRLCVSLCFPTKSQKRQVLRRQNVVYGRETTKPYELKSLPMTAEDNYGETLTNTIPHSYFMDSHVKGTGRHEIRL